MENQGKRLLLAVGLALVVITAFQLIWKTEEPDKKATTTAGSANTPVVKAAAPPIATMPDAPKGAESTIVLDFPGRVKATFSNYGGALVSWRLADAKYAKDVSTQRKGELLPGRPGTGAFYVDFRRLPTPANPQASDHALPAAVEWTGTKVTDTQVKYSLAAKPFVIEKEFTVDPQAYAVKMVVKVTLDLPAGQLARQSLQVSSFAFQDKNVDMEGSQQVEARIWNSASMTGGDTIVASNVKDLIEHPTYQADVRWSGFEHPYLMQAYAPRRLANERVEKFGYAIGADGLMRSDLVFPTVVMKGGEPLTREVVAYLGPKSYKALDSAQAFASYSTGLPDTIDFGWFAIIGKPLLWLLLKFYNFVGNWGIAIMMLTFLVKAATLYWTTKSMRSMKAMASLAPQMKALQERYKDDRQRLQAETMALYKQHSVNPIAGCLPIFLQMPIWIALYRMLSSAGELYQEPFIVGWIDDLTATDPYYILPIILVVTMFAQARLTPATGDSRQQKFLQYGMPLMFGVMSFFFPSGLTIYIFTNTVLSALHSVYMNKFDKKSLALVAQMKKQQEEQAAAAAKIAAGKSGRPAAKP
ncbi:MAG TPA: membrane protein insertase YidC, partial [Kofleriaceae bacterium]|nr:membrane protein insertase YidC [Kofleriaceae bacterium]